VNERRYKTPAALQSALSERIAARYPREEFQFRRNEVAYRRLVARMFTTDPDKWVLKGGFAMILRLDPNRTSNDVDVTYVAQAGEHRLALQALERAIATDLDDFFSFEITGVGDETEDRARRVAIVSRLGAREFTRFRVDLAVPRPDVPADRVQAPPLSGIDEIDALPPVLVLAWPQQIAEKICAIFEQHRDGFSSRSRDLADLGMVADQVNDLDGSALIAALRAEEERRRGQGSLPEGLPATFALSKEQLDAWRSNFAKASRGAPIQFDEACELTTALVDPLLDNSAAAKKWHAAIRTYAS
jgi:hypothetical protein